MAEQNLRYTVVLGDWSDDGHGKMEKHQIELFSSSDELELTEELIVANYRANVAKLGFGLPELWEDYEQSSPTEDQILKLRDELGVSIYMDEKELKRFRSDENFHSQDELSDGELPPGGFYGYYYDGRLYLELEEPLELAMFLILQGLPEVGWRKVEEPPVLFGNYSAPLTGHFHVGYGLFH